MEKKERGKEGVIIKRSRGTENGQTKTLREIQRKKERENIYVLV